MLSNDAARSSGVTVSPHGAAGVQLPHLQSSFVPIYSRNSIARTAKVWTTGHLQPTVAHYRLVVKWHAHLPILDTISTRRSWVHPSVCIICNYTHYRKLQTPSFSTTSTDLFSSKLLLPASKIAPVAIVFFIVGNPLRSKSSSVFLPSASA